MQTLGTEKKHATSWGEQGITKPLVTKNHATSQDKKSHATSWDRKKYTTSWHKKNHATPSGKKNDATSWDKKSMQPLGTKNNVPNMSSCVPISP